MAIRHDDGQYALDCWENADDECDPHTEYSDNLIELRARAATIIAAGRYRYLELLRWIAEKAHWHELEVIEPD